MKIEAYRIGSPLLRITRRSAGYALGVAALGGLIFGNDVETASYLGGGALSAVVLDATVSAATLDKEQSAYRQIRQNASLKIREQSIRDLWAFDQIQEAPVRTDRGIAQSVDDLLDSLSSPYAGSRIPYRLPYDQELRISTKRSGKDIGPILVRFDKTSGHEGREIIVPQKDLFVSCSIEQHSSQMSRYDRILKELVERLDGSEVELDTSAHDISPVSPKYWGHWKHGWRRRIYDQEIYPAVTDTIDRNFPLIPGSPVMVDLFGGDGRFVETFRRHQLSQPYPQLPSEIHIVDLNQRSLRRANRRFARDVEDVFVHEQTDLTAKGDIFEGIPKAPLVTAIGALNAGVVRRYDALQIAGKIFKGMPDRGIFISTGLTPSLLDSVDYRAIGFTPLQMTVPASIFSRRNPNQMYVLRK